MSNGGLEVICGQDGLDCSGLQGLSIHTRLSNQECLFLEEYSFGHCEVPSVPPSWPRSPPLIDIPGLTSSIFEK